MTTGFFGPEDLSKWITNLIKKQDQETGGLENRMPLAFA